jgi:hypothetical protein
MRPRHPRRFALVAALLVLPLLGLAAGQSASHEGHGCSFDRGCVTCRWAADSVADAASPLTLPAPIGPAAVVALDTSYSVALASPEAVSSRGPPLA